MATVYTYMFFNQKRLDKFVESSRKDGKLHQLEDRPESQIRVPPSFLPEGSEPRLGRPLLEVFRVQLDNISKRDLAVYGEIIVGGGGPFFRFIYRRSKDDPQCIKPGMRQSLLLNGPSYPYSADYFGIVVKLKDKNTNQIVSDGMLSHDGRQNYDVPKSRTLTTEKRKGKFVRTVQESEVRTTNLTLDYVHYHYAIMAVVKVSLVDDRESCTVYGTITASSSWSCDCEMPDDCVSVLFKKMPGEAVTVSCGDCIPLLRSVVAVPCVGSLFVVAKLGGLCNEEITCGPVKFDAKNPGTDELVVDAIRVSVTWKIRFGSLVEGLELDNLEATSTPK